MSDDETENPAPRRDERGRYVKGVSGNPAGKPAGILNEATRVAAMLLDASTPVLVSKAIELALNGKVVPLKFCLERIIAPQRDQPIVVATPSEGDGPPDLAGAMALIAAAAAEGTINPSQAATLCQAFADHARGIETQERGRRSASSPTRRRSGTACNCGAASRSPTASAKSATRRARSSRTSAISAPRSAHRQDGARAARAYR